MDVTFHETKSFFVNHPLQGEKAHAIEEFSFMSLPYLSLQVVQDLNDEVTPMGLNQPMVRKQPTLTLEPEELFDSKVRITEDNSEDVSVIENLIVALRK